MGFYSIMSIHCHFERSFAMKKIIGVLGALLALFLLTGCPSKQVDVEGQGYEDVDEEYDTPTRTSKPATTTQQVQEVTGQTLGSVYFDFDKFNIRGDMQSVIDGVSEDLKKRDSYDVVIEGNTDEIGTDEYNYALGTKRAISVRDALVIKGVNRANIRVVSFGESKPVCTEKEKECYQKNRRADIKLSE